MNMLYPRLLIFVALVTLLSGCVILPSAPPQPTVLSLAPSEIGAVADISAKFKSIHGDDLSGFYSMAENLKAMEMRLALVSNAQSSIDIKYFIWQGDEMSSLLFVALYRAADRGVRIRMIVDDLGMANGDVSLSAISKHTNIEIKLYNPGSIRSGLIGPTGEFLVRMRQLNRRMHNKLMVIDGQVAIVGGRNIGNPYFGADEKYNFRDFDVLVTGQVMAGIRESFDEYWNADISYPTQYMKSNTSGAEVRAQIEAYVDAMKAERHRYESYIVDAEGWSGILQSLAGDMYPGEAVFLQDDVTHIEDSDVRLIDMIGFVFERADEEITLVSPYLIPSKDFLANLDALAGRGVKIKLITASMASNNHTIAHSHYKKYRKRLLRAGAELYEFKPHPSKAILDITNVPPIEAKFISLHTKAFVGDRKDCFVGSLNFDPRAVEINTENGLYITSTGFCGELADLLDVFSSPENAWRVTLSEKGKLLWTSGDEVLTRQPARSFGQRVADFFYRLLPIESQL